MRHVGRFFAMVVIGALSGAQAAHASKDRISPPDGSAWVIESADYTGDVQDQIIRLEARYTIRTLRDGWIEIPLAMSGATITAIEIEKKTGEAHIMPRGTTYVLAASKKGTFKVRVKCSSALTQDSQYEGLQVGIPRATFSTLTLNIPRKDVELRQTDQLYVEHAPSAGREGSQLTARLGAADRVDLRWRTKPAAPDKVDPVLYGEVHTLVTIEEQLARLITLIDYRMAQGETKELIVHVPQQINVLNVRGSGIDDWRVTEAVGHKTLTVALSFALKDARYQLVIEGEQAIKDGETSYALPEIALAGVKQERGYVAIARTGSLEVSAGAVEGAHRVDVKELPEVFGSLSSHSPMLAFKYHQHPYQISMAMTRHQDHAVLSGIAEVGHLETVIDRHGKLLTRATYLIQANKKQFLEVILPAKATLWGCTVNGRSVKPVQGADQQLLVPLDALANSATSVSVEMVYFEQRPVFEWTGKMVLQGPVLDVPTTISNWSVYAPSEVKLFRMRGNMEQGAAAVTFLGEPMEVASAEASYKRDARLADAKAKMLEAAEKTGDLLAKMNPVGAYVQRGIQGGMKSNADSTGTPFSSAGDWESHTRSRTIEESARWDGGHDYDPNRQSVSNGPSEIEDITSKMMRPAVTVPVSEEDYEAVRERFAGRLQETGVLPLKIRLPQAGHAYRFSRMMTTTEALRVETSFVHVRLPGGWLAGLGLILFPVGGFALTRFRLFV